MLADFRESFHYAPWELPVDEAILLLGEIVGDITSRTYAAACGWQIRLMPWMAMQAAAAFRKPELPPQVEPERERPSPREVDAAAAVLAQVTAIPN